MRLVIRECTEIGILKRQRKGEGEKIKLVA